MASTINAKSTGSGSLESTADASGVLALQTGGVTAVTIDTAQKVGIGTTTPSYTLDIRGRTQIINTAAGTSTVATFGNDDTSGTSVVKTGFTSFGVTKASINAAVYGNDYMTFNVGSDTERMRIDSSGRLLVGVTSPVGSTFSTIQYDAATYNGFGLNQSANTSGGRFMLFASQATQCGVIDRVGTTSAVVYTTTSDRRLKENIVDAPSAIEHINAVKVRSFNWKNDGHQVKYGVIAQEFFEVEPNAVVKGDDGETIEKTWSVDSSVLVPAMIKAIQEQQTIINDLKARITALEGAK